MAANFGLAWSTEEREQLFSLAGDLPWSMVVSRYRAWAKIHGKPWRSDRAMAAMCNRAGVPRRPSGAYLDLRAVSRLLKVSYATLNRWAHAGQLPYVSQGIRLYVKRSDLRLLAQKLPEHFNGKPYDDLLMLFDSERLAERYSTAQPLPSARGPKPVICVQTGQKYPSMKAAAQAVYVAPQRIQFAVKRGTTAAGFHWKAASEAKP